MRILILTDKYYPKPLANAVCVQQIAEEFKRRGHYVHILAFEDSGVEMPEEYHGITVSSVQTDIRLKLFYFSKNNPQKKIGKVSYAVASFLSKTKKIIYFPWYPLYSIVFPKRILEKMEEMNKKEKYDLVISTFAPFETALAGLWFKRKHNECKWCLYILDTFENQRRTFLPRKMRNASFWVPRFLNSVDLFLYMKSRQHEYTAPLYNKWRKKMFAVDIPMMNLNKKKLPCRAAEKESGCENWVYAGSLGKPHYDLEKVLSIWSKLPEKPKRILHFYSNGPELNGLKKMEKNGFAVKAHDYVDQETLMQVYSDAEGLISIKTSNQISAKIFEYMSYGKKIIHFSGVEDDPDCVYIGKYARGILLRTYDVSDKTCAEIIDNRLSDEDDPIQNDNIDFKAFEMNTPQYTCELIEKKLKEITDCE